MPITVSRQQPSALEGTAYCSYSHNYGLRADDPGVTVSQPSKLRPVLPPKPSTLRTVPASASTKTERIPPESQMLSQRDEEAFLSEPVEAQYASSMPTSLADSSNQIRQLRAVSLSKPRAVHTQPEQKLREVTTQQNDICEASEVYSLRRKTPSKTGTFLFAQTP